ncbi:MAG: oligosaccharide flippase family protein [Rhodobacteraceae bacterium]|nr:oligosaccharide flippase family protein [Paracoccaceae bacterium]
MPRPQDTLRRIAQGPFARNLIAYGASEVAAKLSRLAVVVAVARTMQAEEIGVAAAAMAAADILKSLTETGVGQRIIAAPEDRLQAVCATARRIFVAWSLGLCGLQIALAGAILACGGSMVLAGLIALLALEYLFMPTGLVQAALAMRQGKMRQTAAIAGGQVVGANLAAALLAVVWPGPAALVLPRLLAAPIWLIAMRRLAPWRPVAGQPGVPLSHFTRFGAAVLAIELTKALRMQADKVIVGALMGPEVLGLYFMAFNAGLGLAGSFSAAVSIVVYPHLCAAPDRDAALRQGILVSLGVITPAVMIQALLAPVYVPILFGADWAGLAPVVSILCLAAIPATLWSVTAGWLRASDRAGHEFRLTALLTAALMLSTALMAPLGLTALAWGTLLTSCTVMIGAALPAIAAAFGPRPVRS